MNSPTDHDMIEKLIVLLEHLGREEDYPDTEESELDQVLARCMKRFVDRMPGGFFASGLLFSRPAAVTRTLHS